MIMQENVVTESTQQSDRPMTINEFARMGGLKGGKSRSSKKLKAAQNNLAHAREILAGQRADEKSKKAAKHPSKP